MALQLVSRASDWPADSAQGIRRSGHDFMSMSFVRALILVPWRCLRQLHRHAYVLRLLAAQDLRARLHGSVLSHAWLLLTPLLMLAVYVLVFGEILQVRWPGRHVDSGAVLGANIFAGLVLLGFFSDVVSRAPQLVVSRPNFVKRLAFPLYLLPVVSVGTALMVLLPAVLVLVGFIAATTQTFSVTLMALPLVVLPVALLACGAAWFLSAVGVYMRDVHQVVAPILAALTFLSPVFFPLQAVPPRWRDWLMLNPLAVPVEQMRRICVEGLWPQWNDLAWANVGGLLACWIGLAWFEATREGFADAL